MHSDQQTLSLSLSLSFLFLSLLGRLYLPARRWRAQCRRIIIIVSASVCLCHSCHLLLNLPLLPITATAATHAVSGTRHSLLSTRETRLQQTAICAPNHPSDDDHHHRTSHQTIWTIWSSSVGHSSLHFTSLFIFFSPPPQRVTIHPFSCR